MNDEDINLIELRLSETEGFTEALAKAYVTGRYEMFADVTEAHRLAYQRGTGEADFAMNMIVLALELAKDRKEAGL